MKRLGSFSKRSSEPLPSHTQILEKMERAVSWSGLASLMLGAAAGIEAARAAFPQAFENAVARANFVDRLDRAHASGRGRPPFGRRHAVHQLVTPLLMRAIRARKGRDATANVRWHISGQISANGAKSTGADAMARIHALELSRQGSACVSHSLTYLAFVGRSSQLAANVTQIANIPRPIPHQAVGLLASAVEALKTLCFGSAASGLIWRT